METPNQTLQKCKDKIAVMMGYNDFNDYIKNGIPTNIIPIMEDVARLYSTTRKLIENNISEKIK